MCVQLETSSGLRLFQSPPVHPCLLASPPPFPHAYLVLSFTTLGNAAGGEPGSWSWVIAKRSHWGPPLFNEVSRRSFGSRLASARVCRRTVVGEIHQLGEAHRPGETHPGRLHRSSGRAGARTTTLPAPTILLSHYMFLSLCL